MVNFPKQTGIIDNTPRSDGTIHVKLRVRALTYSGAIRNATNRALLHNGYSPAIISSPDVDITVEEIRKEVRGRWVAEVEIETDRTM